MRIDAGAEDRSAAKTTLRQSILQRRRSRSGAQRSDAASAIRDHALGVPVIARARRVAVYLSMADEPGTAPLIEALLSRGKEVLVPRVGPEHSLQWILLDDEAWASLTTSALGVMEPTTESIGSLADAAARVVLTPALAVDHHGRRLGRGAGYYDRAFDGVNVPRYAIVYEDEVLPEVPHEAHDVAVHGVITPVSAVRFG